MNQERLNEIYNNPIIISNNDVDDLRQLAKDYPYFSKPFEILARYYYQTNHYRFEEMLRQAAIRVADRKSLYDFIHTDFSKVKESKSELISETEESNLQKNEKSEDEKLGLDAFLNEDEINDSVHSMDDSLKEIEINSDVQLGDTNETPFEFEGTFKLHETISIPEEQDIIGEEIATEFSFSKSFIQNDEPLESQIPDYSNEEEIVINDIDEDEAQRIELITEENLTLDLPHIDLSKEIEPIKKQVEIENKEVNKPSELDLRKYPVYNIETFVPQSTEEINQESDSSKDFFFWLNNPKHTDLPAPDNQNIEEEPVPERKEKVSKSLDIIEKFISINPQISRPKKEFFSPENMAKRSEVLDLEFVSETLAEIYYQQGNFDYAIKAYEKLSLQNPSKQSFFADLIDKIKKERK